MPASCVALDNGYRPSDAAWEHRNPLAAPHSSSLVPGALSSFRSYQLSFFFYTSCLDDHTLQCIPLCVAQGRLGRIIWVACEKTLGLGWKYAQPVPRVLDIKFTSQLDLGT